MRNPLGCVIQAVLLLAIALLAGCVAVGVVAHKFSGPQTVNAKYVLPEGPTLVLVETYKNPAGTFVMSELVARAIIEDLKSADPPPSLTPVEKLYRFRDAQPSRLAAMKIGDVATAVDARQVIYVNVVRTTVEPVAGGEFLQGDLLVQVKVVDREGRMLWPESGEGYPVGTSTPTVQTSAAVNATTLEDQMARTVGTNVGRLFHPWKPTE